MRVLQSWLRDYIDFRLSPEELADKLSMLGLEIEGVEHLGEKYRGFVIGNIERCERHPNADKLSVCIVNVGNEKLQIVCGAPNVAAGQKVPVGLSGATVPRNQHDPSGKPFVLSHVKLRGVDSFGMICSAYELGLGEDSNGIMVLDSAAKIGQPLAKYLGMDDVAYDVEITANRPDLLSHIGVAREIGVLTGKQPKLPTIKVKESKTPISKFLKVEVQDKANCQRFAARMIRDVSIGPSPKWLQDRLTAVGLRPRNNIVDITNYVMLECGQPLHAFDYALLDGGKIRVRQLQLPLEFVTLDGKKQSLPSGVVMVCDGSKEVSIAGIMGGANSEISGNTTDVVLESAYWNPSSIRRTRRVLAINTDASQRFERGADPNATDFAINRAAQLIVELAGGELLKGTIDVYPKRILPRKIALRSERVNAVLGTSLSQKGIAALLGSLGVKCQNSKSKTPQFLVPTFRVDIEREIDLVEEVARVYGYNNIGVETSARIDLSHPFPKTSFVDQIRSLLIGYGYREAINNSMQASAHTLEGGRSVQVRNPQNKEMSVLRTSLLPGILESIARNLNFGNASLRLFEIGHTFSVDSSNRPKLVENFLETEKVCIALTGTDIPLQWSIKPRQVDFFDVKGEMADVLRKIILDKSRFISYSTTETLDENALGIEINGSYAGYLGSVSDKLLKQYGIEQQVFVAELELPALASDVNRKYEQVPRFPRVRRDIALVVNSGISASSLEQAILKASGSLLQSVILFDLYEGDKLPKGTKSLAFSLGFISPDRTLVDAEVDSEISRITKILEQEFGATLRSI